MLGSMSSHPPILRELHNKPVTRTLIAKLKARSVRQGKWFKVLQSQERGLVNATLSWVKVVKSETLRRILVGILSKASGEIWSPLNALRERGRRISFRISELAVRWGNSSAGAWRSDVSFHVCLGSGVAGPFAPSWSTGFQQVFETIEHA